MDSRNQHLKSGLTALIICSSSQRQCQIETKITQIGGGGGGGIRMNVLITLKNRKYSNLLEIKGFLFNSSQ